jgi:DNA polymerase III delta prime subunit
MSNNNVSIPWVEKYRPTNFNDIVLESFNKKIMKNIINTQNFPNLLLYGPPGTGKTTTIINLVESFQKKNGKNKKELVIHLNASDERGIDIIRNQIYQFVNSKPLFNDGTKFIILDEVDYMTKNAQYALKCLLQTFKTNNVRFCLICNYISRIDESLQNDFIRLRFNQLPETNIIKFLKNLCVNENLAISEDSLYSIQKIYKSDIRSMINHIQSQQFHIKNYSIINVAEWEKFTHFIKNIEDNTDKKFITNYINNLSNKYNIEKKNLIKDYCNYLIRKQPIIIDEKVLNMIEFILHIAEPNINYLIYYFSISLSKILREQ